MSIIAVARDQAGDLLRRRYLLVILILAVAVIAMYVGYLVLMRKLVGVAMESSGGPAGADMDVIEGTAMMQLMIGVFQASLHGLVTAIGTLLCLFLMCYSVRSEISKGTARMVLCRPVARYEFVVGKWLGCVSIVFLYSLLISVLVCLYTYYAFGRLIGVVPLSLVMGFLKAVMVGSVGMALSLVLRPLLSVAIAYLAAAETFLFISNFLHGAAREIVRIPFYVLPSYKALNMYEYVIKGTALPAWEEIVYRVVYALLLSGLMLLAASLLFRRKDLV